MKSKFLLFALVVTGTAVAQRSSIYAITDLKAGGVSWMNIREASREGEGKVILENQRFSGTRSDIQTNQNQFVRQGSTRDVNDLPLVNGGAALAYDAKHNRIYYSTMFSGDIRYVTLGKEDNYYQVGKVYDAIPLPNNVPVSATNQGPVITRLVQGADNYIYGLSNNGDAFFRLSTTDKNPMLEDLGKLVDDPANGKMSVHASCSSWGGDMVATADGDLYVFSMYQQVFKINTKTKVATHLGKIEGLPKDFTVNGAAVDENGAIVLSSASVAGQIGIIEDATVLKAKVKESPGWFNSSDLASSYLLFSKKGETVFAEFNRSIGNSGVGVFPNPVTNGQIIVHFKEGFKGKHSLDLLDIAGSSKMQQFINLNGENQRVTLRTGVLASGLYLLRVSNAANREVETIKVMIQ